MSDLSEKFSSRPISEGFRAKQARELAGEIIAAQADGFTTIAVGDWFVPLVFYFFFPDNSTGTPKFRTVLILLKS
jgi:hypothetical protein